MGKGGKQSGLVVSYLVLYNAACTLGWLHVLSICLTHISKGTVLTDDVWKEVQLPLKIVQTAACMEVIHSLIGIVKSPWFTTFMQVFSRVWTLWAVMDISPHAQSSVFITLACTSWGLVEVPRYLFYALNLLNVVPYPLFWLRYSLFGVLYPTGITGELGCMYFAALETYQSNFTLFVLIVFVALTYIPGSPTMYGHMVKTRGKQFKEYKESTSKKKDAKDQ
jgi:very-long-chain (3R)-3-hydroxyacyl-CoA dehydratase